MKRFFYHLLCLIVALVQTALGLAELFVLIAFLTGGSDSSSFITATIAIIIVQFLLAMLDRWIREADCFNFIGDCLVIMVVAPAKFFLHLITFVKLFKYMKEKDSEFGKRGDYHITFWSKVYYIAWNEKGRKEFRLETAAQREKRLAGEERARQERERRIEANKQKEKERIAFLRSIERADGVCNLHLVPISVLDYSKFLLFSGESRGVCQIDELYINGHLVNTAPIRNCVDISLKSGRYTIKVLLHIEHEAIKSDTDSGRHPKKTVKKYYEVTGVYLDENYEYHLVMAAQIQGQWTEYTYERTGEWAKDQFDGWKEDYMFNFMTKEGLEEFVSYWHASPIKLL